MTNSVFVEKWRNRLSAPIGHLLISSRSDDTYIAAFPRSGSTWLRTILVNILEPEARGDPDIFNARIPAVSIRNSIAINQLDSPRLIMTHCCWNKNVSKVVYLIRDGRDAFISYLHFQLTRRGLDMNIEQFSKLYHNTVFGPTWATHTESWLEKGMPTLTNQSILVKFEDLKADTETEITRICEFLGITVTNKVLKIAIENASIENARKIEQMRQGEIIDNNASFYRHGTSEQWKEPVYQNVIKEFGEKSSNALRLGGYVAN